MAKSVKKTGRNKKPKKPKKLSDRARRVLARRAAACAARVLRLFEYACPGDSRPRLAVDAARAWARGEISVGEARKAALASHSAARGTDGAACAAARSAGHAAATAHVAAHGKHAAGYAEKATALGRASATPRSGD